MWSLDRAQILNKGLVKASTSSTPTEVHLLLLSFLPRPTDSCLSSGAEGPGKEVGGKRTLGSKLQGHRRDLGDAAIQSTPFSSQHPLNSRKVGPPPSCFLKEAGTSRRREGACLTLPAYSRRAVASSQLSGSDSGFDFMVFLPSFFLPPQS